MSYVEIARMEGTKFAPVYRSLRAALRKLRDLGRSQTRYRGIARYRSAFEKDEAEECPVFFLFSWFAAAVIANTIKIC